MNKKLKQAEELVAKEVENFSKEGVEFMHRMLLKFIPELENKVETYLNCKDDIYGTRNHKYVDGIIGAESCEYCDPMNRIVIRLSESYSITSDEYDIDLEILYDTDGFCKRLEEQYIQAQHERELAQQKYEEDLIKEREEFEKSEYERLKAKYDKKES